MYSMKNCTNETRRKKKSLYTHSNVEHDEEKEYVEGNLCIVC
jgi:hypothetical protein